MQSALIEKARGIQRKLPIQEIKKFGIERRRDDYFLNIAYPSLQAMDSIEPEVIVHTIPSVGNRIALYLHIPFCTRLCYYCHYYKVFNAAQALVEAYLTALMKEITFYSQAFGGLKVESVYIGGGTPSYLDPDQMKRLFEHIRRHATINSGAEITFEMHPESVTLERLKILRASGVNRISMGVESFNDTILASENRGHTVDEAIRAYEAIVSAGFENVNLDLIYGLRHQTISIWEENLERMRELKPISMCAYYLRVKTSTPDAKLYQSGADGFPSEEDLILMHIMTFEAMKEIGYEQLIVDWFIRTTEHFHKYQDHNWRQTDRIPLLGLGASAYSYLGGIQYYNINDIAQYIEWLNRGKTAIWRGEVLPFDEKMRRTAVLGLKMGIDRQDFRSIYGVDFCEQFSSTTK
ncbi:MAG: coproporphyrinogen III oxidase family protein [Candidatus Spechtbacteria bacterium]|nr:coproporphyrinogen III oxidase family protein [Candidatus Spechtbacteria bacterium]